MEKPVLRPDAGRAKRECARARKCPFKGSAGVRRCADQAARSPQNALMAAVEFI